jgi:hypothetical protein
MARLIPNENTRVHFLLAIADADLNPVVAEIEGGVDLTGFIVTLDASSTGNTVPTPSFASLFETSISGTVSATFTAEFYRDDEDDLAWETLPRATNGFFVVSRFGYTGVDGAPAASDIVEVWPVRLTARSAMALTNNESQRFGIEAAIPVEPNENAVVAAT